MKGKRITKTGRPRKAAVEWPVFDTLGQAASALGGRCLPILKAAKRAGCTAFRHNRVYIADFFEWHFASLMEASKLPPGFATWNDVLSSEKAKRERVRREKEEGAVLDLATAEREAAEAESFYGGELDRMERELPSALEGLKADKISALIKAFNKELRAKSREKFKAVAPTAQTKKKK